MYIPVRYQTPLTNPWIPYSLKINLVIAELVICFVETSFKFNVICRVLITSNGVVIIEDGIAARAPAIADIVGEDEV